jgi:hypothetical protein
MDRLKRMHDLIKRKATGTPDEFAKKLGICKSMLMIHLKELKVMGAPVKYDQLQQNYYYTEQCKLIFEFEREGKLIKGGQNIFDYLSHSNHIRMAIDTFDPQGL